jgi:hypothetical protein
VGRACATVLGGECRARLSREGEVTVFIEWPVAAFVSWRSDCVVPRGSGGEGSSRPVPWGRSFPRRKVADLPVRG